MSDEISKPNELPKAYDPSTIEQRWAEYWVNERLFDVPSPNDTQIDEKKFTMLLPPPNVTGRLHMGHMLNQAEMDILTRWHRMSGDISLWVPGTDHAGIATQMMVERQLKTEGTSRTEMGREAFTERVWAWKKEYGGAITDQMRRLGASVDWSREYFTMDDGLSVAVKEAFVRLYEQGLIYRGAYIVNWDPQIQTAVSDLEVESEERMGKLYHVRYPLADGTGSIVIATTRPETMLGDVAVVVNPEDERYTSLVGKIVALPLTGREIPILADEWAKPEFGTGAVKVTPAHDPNDFAIGQRHGLPQPSIFDTTAHITLAGSPYDGMERFAAREKIVADLDALGLLVEVKDHPMTVPVSQRSGVVIEPRLSMQWFLAVNKTPASGGDSVAAKAIAAVRDGHIRFTPEQYRKTYDEWMKNIYDWCISRQLWWGHRIPAWHCSAGHITVSRETPTACGTCGSAAITQETDVLDTWFSSGLLPFTVFGWPDATKDLAAFYPTELLVTGFDILFFWVARMIMLGTHFMMDVPMPDGSARKLADAVPFKEVYIHGLVRDADRQKMSKTKGNVINPIDIIERFGTDAVRFTLASMASPGTDIAFSEARTEGYRAFANKIWNSARFLFMNVERAKEAGISIDAKQLKKALRSTEHSRLEGRWIVARLAATSAVVDEALKEYRFDEAAHAIYQFFWGDFCDWYLEIVKLRLNFDEGADLEATTVALTTLLAVFEGALRLLNPFMPFITEEIWHAFWPQIGLPVPLKSIALAHYPEFMDFARDTDGSVTAMILMQEMIVAVRGLRKEMGVPEKEAAPVRVFADNRVVALVDANTDLLRRLARVNEVEFVSATLTGNGSRSTAEFDVQVVYERVIDVVAEREKLTKDLAKYQKGLDAAQKQLGNEGFMARAPEHIVAGLRKQFAETQMLFDKAKAALDELSAE
ncbi:valyl-tRNA synthetase [Granulicella pectinivorans]|uniref:Valine--tRNA ligase n=1 Tax=Granulicella pectinivorans TaxID=474950 RepID=A0A1I6LTG6_9BACT|nr:valine--tRNA ligase [Granulicella pectinivorans]SFS06743.1 valyl-tRNA synthetase [Granulicella pectinivorans]